MKVVESNVADAILQTKRKITVGGHTFNVSHPTPATIIEVSKLVSEFPNIKLDKSNFVYEVLSIAKDCSNIGLIVAQFILGAKKQPYHPTKCDRLLNWLKMDNYKAELKMLSDFLMTNLSNDDLHFLLVEILKGMQLESFFDITTSLFEVNLLKATR